MSENAPSWSDYYNTPEWAEKRNARLKLDGFKCAKCGFTRALEVHHINYERFMHEDVARDLITLCKKCHKEIEEQKKIQDMSRVSSSLSSGNYHFVVKSHAVGYSNSDKLPPNTQYICYSLEIPYYENGKLKTVTVKQSFNVYARAMLQIRHFTDCIGLTPEKGRARTNLEEADGKTGVCALSVNAPCTFIDITNFLAPSQLPKTTSNEAAWREYINTKED